MKQINWRLCIVASLILAYPLIMGILAAKATVEPRYDHFRSRLSGNVVLIPSRCWQEDSLGHLYEHNFDGAKLVLHCHHKGY